MNRFTKRIVDFFTKEDITYYFDHISDDEDGCDDLTVPACLSDIPGLIIRVIVTDSGKCTFLVKLGTAKDENTVNRLYPVLNKLNSKYSFVSFSINDKKSVMMNLNFMLSTRMQLNIIDEYFRAIVSIGDEASKEILPVLWDMIVAEKAEVFGPDDLDDEYEWEDPGEEEWPFGEPFYEEEESFIFDGENTDSEVPAEESGEESEEDEEDPFSELFSTEDSEDEDESDDSDEESAAS